LDGAKTGGDGCCGGDRKSKSPPCRRRRDKDGAPSGVEMRERVGQPPHPASGEEQGRGTPTEGLRGFGVDWAF
jgi:hypothetical protein